MQSTALLFGAAVLIPASSTPPSTTPCELRLDACALHHRTTFQSSQASNLLSFVAMEPHSLWHALPWSLDICSTQRSPVLRVQMHVATNRDTHLCPPHISSVYLTTTYVLRSGRITNGMRSGRNNPTKLLIFIPNTGTGTHTHRIDPPKKSLGPAQPPPHRCRTSPLLLVQMRYGLVCGL